PSDRSYIHRSLPGSESSRVTRLPPNSHKSPLASLQVVAELLCPGLFSGLGTPKVPWLTPVSGVRSPDTQAQPGVCAVVTEAPRQRARAKTRHTGLVLTETPWYNDMALSPGR